MPAVLRLAMTRPGVFSPVSHSIQAASNFSGSGGGGPADMSITRRVATYAPDMTDPSKLSSSNWKTILFGRDSFFPVLFLAIATILISPMIDEYHFGFLVVYPASALLVILAYHRSRVSKRTMTTVTILLIVVGVMAVITSIARFVDYSEDRHLVALSSAMFAVLIACAFPIVVRRAFQHERVTLNTLAAGITAYLLIGIFFASLYRCDSALQHYQIFHQTLRPNAGDYTYFSFITLTTVGFGDLTPATEFARTLAIFEAILGQVFLVTAVARIVSLLGSEKSDVPRLGARHDFTQQEESD